MSDDDLQLSRSCHCTSRSGLSFWASYTSE